MHTYTTLNPNTSKEAISSVKNQQAELTPKINVNPPADPSYSPHALTPTPTSGTHKLQMMSTPVASQKTSKGELYKIPDTKKVQMPSVAKFQEDDLKGEAYTLTGQKYDAEGVPLYLADHNHAFERVSHNGIPYFFVGYENFSSSTSGAAKNNMHWFHHYFKNNKAHCVLNPKLKAGTKNEYTLVPEKNLAKTGKANEIKERVPDGPYTTVWVYNEETKKAQANLFKGTSAHTYLCLSHQQQLILFNKINKMKENKTFDDSALRVKLFLDFVLCMNYRALVLKEPGTSPIHALMGGKTYFENGHLTMIDDDTGAFHLSPHTPLTTIEKFKSSVKRTLEDCDLNFTEFTPSKFSVLNKVISASKEDKIPTLMEKELDTESKSVTLMSGENFNAQLASQKLQGLDTCTTMSDANVPSKENFLKRKSFFSLDTCTPISNVNCPTKESSLKGKSFFTDAEHPKKPALGSDPNTVPPNPTLK